MLYTIPRSILAAYFLTIISTRNLLTGSRNGKTASLDEVHSMSYFPSGNFGSGADYLAPPNSIPAAGPATGLDSLATDVGTAAKFVTNPGDTLNYLKLKAGGLVDHFKSLYDDANTAPGFGSKSEERAVDHQAGVLSGDETYFSIGGHREIGNKGAFGNMPGDVSFGFG
jgi:hypothetical protein